MNLNDVEKMFNLVKSSSCTAVLTGAGVSTDSGIPDYRSPGTGLWEKMDQSVVSLQGFLARPQDYYSYSLELYPIRKEAKPNKVHTFLAELETKGFVSGLMTQNVDGLHKEAGSKKVYELHGSLKEGYCLSCNSIKPMEEVMEQVENGKNPPTCDLCDGIIKPKAVFFGESLPEKEWQFAMELTEKADLLIVLGTSLQVYPVNTFPQIAVNNGAGLVIVNMQATPFDKVADLVIHEGLDLVFTELERLFAEKTGE